MESAWHKGAGLGLYIVREGWGRVDAGYPVSLLSFCRIRWSLEMNCMA